MKINIKKNIRNLLIIFLQKILSNKSLRKLFFASILETDSDSFAINGEERVIQMIENIGIKDFIDVGASTGEWTSLVIKNIKNYASLVLYEPNKNYYERLLSLKSSNSKIKFFPLAISNTEGFVNFIFDGVFSKIDESAKDTVKSINHKQLIQNHDVNLPYLIKIDAEGSDLEILKQFSQTGLCDKSFVQVEFGEAQINNQIVVKDFVDLLPTHKGYIVSNLKLLPLTIIKIYDFCNPLLNILFIPKSYQKKFMKLDLKF